MNKFQIFRLIFSWDMSKMHYYIVTSNKFSKHQELELSPPQCPITFNIGDLKLRDWLKCGFSNWLWRNRTLKNHLRRHFSDAITTKSPKNVTKITSPNFSFCPSNQNFWLRQWILRTTNILPVDLVLNRVF